MKIFIFLYLILLSSCTIREQGLLTIEGEVKGLEGGIVRLYTYPPSNLLLDSCEIKAGKYSLKSKLDAPQLGLLAFEITPTPQRAYVPMINLFLSPSDMKIVCDVDDVKGTLKVEGNSLHDEYLASERFLKNLQEYQQASRLSDQIQLAFAKADMATVRSLTPMRDSLYLYMLDRLFEWKTDATISAVVAYWVSHFSGPLSGRQIKQLAERFDTCFQSSYYVSQLKEYAMHDQRLQPGMAFPDFKAFDQDGKQYSLSDFEGKYLFIEFSASWCSWCKKELPFIQKAYKQLKDENITFLTIMMDTEREAWLHDVKKETITWLCLSDLKGMKESPMVDAYNLRGLPDSFVIDPQGRIIRRDLRGDEVVSILRDLLSKD